jgi:hypothetical protein
VNPWSTALLGGLVYSCAFSTWWITGLTPGTETPNLAPDYRALVYIQALAAAVLLPAAIAGEAPRTSLLPPVLLVAVPWPLVTLFALSGGLQNAALVSTQLGLVIWAMAMAGIWHLLGRIFREPVIPRAALQAGSILAPTFLLPRVLEAMIP